MITELTPEQTASLPVWRDRWIQRALMTAKDWRPAEAVALVPAIYADAKKPAPELVETVPSPRAALQRIAELRGTGLQFISPSDGAGYCGWRAFYSFFNHHFGLAPQIKNYVKFDECGPFMWWFFKRVAIVSAPPERFNLERPTPTAPYRNHCPNGPALRWADGFELYFWHGVNVRPEWILHPDEVKVETVLAEANTERRRALYEIVGYDRLFGQLNPCRLQRDDFGELYESTLLKDDGKQPARFVKVKCPSTGRVYINRVRPDVKTAREAVASRWRLTAAEYKPEVQS